MLVGGLEWWENAVIAASAIPIALVCNAVRITTVGVMYNFNSSLAEGFHDSLPAALLMMVLAVGLLVLEMKILSWLVVIEDTGPERMAVPGAGAVARVSPPSASPGATAGFPVIPGGKPRHPRGDAPPPTGGGKMG
jgi:exosortase/archaeosortase family protein